MPTSSFAGVLPALAVLVLLAGCVGSSGGGASVSFDGEGNGSHDDATRCDKGARSTPAARSTKARSTSP